MHELLSTRPNQVPIAITTALTPFGPKTVLHQPPSNSEDSKGDVEDNSTIIKSEPGSLALTLAKGKRTAAQPSRQIWVASRVLGGASGAGLRQTGLKDQFFEVQKQIQPRILERDRHAQQLAERQQILQEKRHLLEDFKLGLVTVDEYRAAVLHLGGDETQPIPGSDTLPTSSTSLLLPPVPLSPEWQLTLPRNSEFASPADP
ncbi:hypothetical protein FRC09_000593 [Ceratobasidium sp. 395]|nr:hypothetical protein FRC09_000593 [Ceratobasidium sp. 395]